MSYPSFKMVADRAVLVEFGTVVDDDTNRAVIALDQAIASSDIPGIAEVIPAMVNLLIIFDPLKTTHDLIQSAIQTLLPVDATGDTDNKKHVVNICYEEQYSPDLEAVANACDMSVEAVINAHTSASYRVSMYGFVAGFAYLAGIPRAIQVPRKATPVRDIAAGSVLIAGPQCLTTTLIMPTGWSIIGRTDVQVITGDPDKPFLYNIGDTVKFQRIRSDQLARDMQ